MNKKISIIIPAYNVENCVEQSIESCLRQSLKEIEIICVNDGSTDGTVSLLEKYFSRGDIELVSQENKGTGAARNTGIHKATGEYIYFLDADDCLPSDDTLEKLYYYAKANNVNICGGNAVIERNGEILPCDKTHPTYGKFICPTYGMNKYEDIQNFIGFTRFIYNRCFLLEHNIVFPEISECEDPFFFVSAFHAANTFFAVDMDTYQIHRGDHIRTYNDKKTMEETLLGVSLVLKFANENKLSKLMVNMLDDVCNTWYNIIMYPFMWNDEKLIGQLRQMLKWIDNDLLCLENRMDLIEKFEENGIKREIQDAENEKKALDDLIGAYKEVCIYGAGIVAIRTLNYLEKYGVKVKKFIVTSMNGNVEQINGIPVGELADSLEYKDTMIIIALVSTNEVNKNLISKGFNKIYAMNFSKMRVYI